MAALVRTIRALPNFPADGQIEIGEAGRGSFVTKLSIYTGIAGGLAGMGSLGFDVADALKKPDSEIARCVAWTMVDDGVTKAGVRCGGSYEVLKSQMPAVARLIEGRENEPSLSTPLVVSRSRRDLDTILDKAVPDDVGASLESAGVVPHHRRFTNVPADPDTVQLPGRFIREADGLYFVQQNGARGPLEEASERTEPPTGVLVVARLSAVRGPHGGWADRHLRLHDWFPATDEERQPYIRPTPDIWQRGGDDEEFDLLPGQQSEDLRNVADPGHDLYDEDALIAAQAPAAYTGDLVSEGDDWTLLTEDGDSFALEGDVEPPYGRQGDNIVVVGRAGLEADDRGRRRLLVEGIYPSGS